MMVGEKETNRTADPVLVFEEASKVRPGDESGSLQSLDFVLPKGEVTVFLGFNRWERQTLLDVITGLLPPDGGRVLFNGMDLSRASEDDKNSIRGQMGIVTDPPVYLNNVRIMENLRLPMRYHKRKRTREINSILESLFRDLGVPPFPDVIPSQLNKGFLGVSALVRALSIEPDLLVLERPMECLGKKNAYLLPKVYDRYVLDHGGAVLVLTDHSPLASAIADRIARFEKGRLSFSDRADGQENKKNEDNP